MKCECGGDVKTIDSRKIVDGVWRRRKCKVCGTEFTTAEVRCETIPGERAGFRGNTNKPPPSKRTVVMPKVAPVTRPKVKRAKRVKPVVVAKPLAKKEVAAPVIAPIKQPEPVVVAAPIVVQMPAPAPVAVPKPVPTAPEVKQIAARNRIEDMRNQRLLEKL